MRVITRENFSGVRAGFLGHVRTERQLLGIVKRAVLFWRGEIGVMRWPPGEHEEKWVLSVCPIPKILLSIPRLSNRIIAFPLQFLRPVCVISRVIIVMRAFQNFPVIEPLSPLARDEGGASIAIDVPFADKTGVVPGIAQDLADRDRIGV